MGCNHREHVRGPVTPVFGEALAAEGRCYRAPVQMMQLRHGIFDEATISGITSDTVREVGRLAERSADVRRFRPNIVVRSTRAVPFEEDEWVDDSGDNTQLPVGFSNPLGRAVELVPEYAKGLRDDGFGDGKVDLTIDGEVEEISRPASELQCADKDVGISDDALHERVRDSWTACSTTASTSASLMSPRR